MALEERVYSVLFVSSNERFNQETASLLPAAIFSPISFATNISAAKRTRAQNHFDFIIINSPLTDGFGTDFAIDSSEASHTIVLQLVKNELYDEIFEKNSVYGVFTLAKPLPKQSMIHAMHWLVAAKSKVTQLEQKTISIESKMQEIRLVNKAKWLLIEKEKMPEADAHRHIEKQAMDRCISKRAVAEEIIQKYAYTV